MDAKEIVHLAQQIEKSCAERNYGNILTFVSNLDKSQVTSEQLETTDVVKVLYKVLKTCGDDGVKKATKSLLSKWKKKYGEETGRGAKRERTVSCVATSPREVEDGGVSDSFDGSEQKERESTSASSDFQSVRVKCVQLLLAALRPEPSDQVKASQLAGDIERHVHELHKSQVKYKTCVRSKVSNLRNPKSDHLRHGLLSGALTPEAFAKMSAEEMAGGELRRLREEYSSKGVNERQLPQGVEGTATRKIRCERCGGSDCRVTQVSRGALFLPAWVRRGGPDDDAMTFVTCSGCGQQWYHSGWNCL